MKNLSGQQSLWLVFPILLVLAILIAGIILLPTIQTEIRSRASEPIIVPITQTETPEIICSELYSPVCGSDNQTYNNGCEANLAGVSSHTLGSCITQYTLPTTN